MEKVSPTFELPISEFPVLCDSLTEDAQNDPKLKGILTDANKLHSRLLTVLEEENSAIIVKNAQECIAKNVAYKLNKENSFAEILCLSEMPNLSLDLTNVPQEHKDRLTQCGGNLVDNSLGFVSYKALRIVQNSIIVNNANALMLPALCQVNDDIQASSATYIDISKLKECHGSVELASVSQLYAAVLDHVGGRMDLRSAKDVHLPRVNAKLLIVSQNILNDKARLQGFQGQVRSPMINPSL